MSLSSVITELIRSRRLNGTVISVGRITIVVRITGGAVIPNVRVVGAMPSIGDIVLVEWNGYEPIVSLVAGSAAGGAISYAVEPSNTGTVPKEGVFNSAGWVTDEDGVIYNADTYKCEIHPDGVIKLGGTGGIILDPGTPEIRMGDATAYMTGAGIWMGDDASTYKIHIGNPSGDHMYWDGAVLHITGDLEGGSSIAGTSANTFTINDDDDDVTAKLILARSTGGDAELQWNGTTLSLVHSSSTQWSTTGDGDMRIYDRLAVGTAVNTRYAFRVYSDDYVLGSYAYATEIVHDWLSYDTNYTGVCLVTCNKSDANMSRTSIGFQHRHQHYTTFDHTGTLYGYVSELYFWNNASVGDIATYKHFGTSIYNPYGSMGSRIGYHYNDSGSLSITGDQRAFTADHLTSASGTNYFLYGNKGKSRLGDQLTIAGWEDVIQLDVVGHAGQSNPIFRIKGNSDQLRLAYDDSNYATIGVASDGTTTIDGTGGNLILNPPGDLILDPDGLDVLPDTNYETNLGSETKKWLTLYAAELIVETLVAKEVMATIGGRILVGPTTQLEEDLGNTNIVLNSGFETAGGGDPDFFANWTESAGDGAIADEIVIFYNGAHSCKMTSGISANTHIYQDITVVQNKTYTLQFHTRGDAVTAGRYGVYDNTNSAWLISVVSTDQTDASWERISCDFTAPSNCVSVRIYFYCGADDAAQVYFDYSFMVPSSIVVKYNNLGTDDYVYMEGGGTVEFMKITGAYTGTGPYTYPARRNLDGTSFNTWIKGDAVFNTQQEYEGFIDIYADTSIGGGSGPTIAGFRRKEDIVTDYGWKNYNNWDEWWVIGNLNGYYGYGADTSGIGLGDPDNTNIVIDATDGIRIRDYLTSVFEVDASGVVTVGDTATEHIVITSSSLKVMAATYERITIDTSGLLIRDSGGNAVFTFDNSLGAEFTLPLTLASTGGIYQGSVGSFSSPDTGFKLYQSSSEGVFEVWSGGTKQIYIDPSDMSLRAGGGDVVLNEEGIYVEVPIDDMNDSASYKFGKAGTTWSGIWGNDDATFGNSLFLDLAQIAGKDGYLYVRSQAPSGYTSRLRISTNSYGNFASITMFSTSADQIITISEATKFRIDKDIEVTRYDGGTTTDYDVGLLHTIAPTHLYDTTTSLWNFTLSRNAATYDFNANGNGNDWPTYAKAVLIMFGGQWSSAGNSYTMSARENGVSTAIGQVRSQNANTLNPTQAVVPCDSNGDFEIVVTGNAISCGCRLVGYFL